MIVHLPNGPMDAAEFLAFCEANPELRIERTAQRRCRCYVTDRMGIQADATRC
jgi:hypothetical protein